MAAVSYSDIRLKIDDYDLLAKSLTINGSNNLSVNRVLNNYQETQFDGYGINGFANYNINISFYAETATSGTKFCLEDLTGNVDSEIKILGTNSFKQCYLQSLNVNIQPFTPVVVDASFVCYEPPSVFDIDGINTLKLTPGFFLNDSEFYLINKESGITWVDANREATGMGGRLAILDSAEKNNRVPQHNGAMWIGANDSGTEGTWRWVNGTTFWTGTRSTGGSVGGAYNNWDGGQPDNALFNVSGEDYLQRLPNGQWNDVVNDPSLYADVATWWFTKGYVLEYTGGSIYKDSLIYGHTVRTVSGEFISDENKQQISYGVICERTPRYMLGETIPSRVFLDKVEKELTIKSTQVDSFIDYDGYEDSFYVYLTDKNGRSASTISFPTATVISQNFSTQQDGFCMTEIKAKEIIL
jgi:hypothetical protein